MKKIIFLALIACQTIHSYGQLDSAFFTIDELKAIRKQQIRLHYCDSARKVLESKDTLNQQSIVKLDSIIEKQRTELGFIDSYNHTLKINLLDSEKKIKRLERKQKLFKTGFIITTGTTAGLMLLILAQ